MTTIPNPLFQLQIEVAMIMQETYDEFNLNILGHCLSINKHHDVILEGTKPNLLLFLAPNGSV